MLTNQRESDRISNCRCRVGRRKNRKAPDKHTYMNWKIIADSSCDLKKADMQESAVSFETVPFTIKLDDRDFIDDESLDVEEMLTDMEHAEKIGSSACPSPHAWMQACGTADHVVALTISSALSGSYDSARAAGELLVQENPDRHIHVVDSRSTGPAIALCVRYIAERIRSGECFEKIVQEAENCVKNTKTVFALCSFDNLVKNGRMNRIVGFVAKKLGLWGIGIATAEGKIGIRGKARGVAKALEVIIEDMKSRGFEGGHMIISHCRNQKIAEELRNLVQKIWPTADISVLPTRGLDSFYAEREGLIVAYC